LRKELLVFIFVLLVASVSAQALVAPRFNVTFMNQDPDPARPGSYVDLRFKIQNDGEATAEDVMVRIAPEYPFSLDPGEDPLRSLGDIPGYGNSRNVMVVKYTLRVADDAVQGVNTIRIQYRLGDSQWITEEFDIDVRTVDATVSIQSVETIPEKVQPGEPAKVRIKVKNIADSTLRDVTVKFDLALSTIEVPSQAQVTQSNLYDMIPFAPLRSVTEQKIKTLLPGEEYTFSYDMITYPDAEPRVYKIPVQVQFRDDLDEQYEKNDIVGIIVSSKPDLRVLLDSTTLNTGVATGEVVVRFVNKGLADVKFLNVELDRSDSYEIISAEEVYLGNIDSDDYETAEFTLHVPVDKVAGAREITLPIRYAYMDSTNNAFTATEDIVLKLRDPGQLGQQGGSPVGLIIGLLVIGAILFLIFRKRRRKD